MQENNKQDADKTESPVETIVNVWNDAEEGKQLRLVVGFGVAAAAVAVGSYWGVGRHVKALTKTSGQEFEIIRNYVAAIGEVTVADFEMRANQASVIRSAMENGDKFKHFPGVGVWLEGGKNV